MSVEEKGISKDLLTISTYKPGTRKREEHTGEDYMYIG